MIMKNEGEGKMIIGSYPFRGTVNICRLICVYFKIPYEDQFFNPFSWKKYKQEKTSEWLFSELPFLQDGDFSVTQTYSMCEYIIRKSGKLCFLGKSLEDQLAVDELLWGKDIIQSILSLVIENKNNPNKLLQCLKLEWETEIQELLLEYERKCPTDGFYLGYLTIIDFIIHQTFEYCKDIYRKHVYLFPKLIGLRQRVSKIPEIQDFEHSERTIKSMCPLQFYRKWKLETMKS